MIFLMEQYDQLELDDWELGEFQSKVAGKEATLDLFNKLPPRIQSIAVAWTASDSVFRDEAINAVCEHFTGVSYSKFKGY